jgi:hypothetical protein
LLGWNSEDWFSYLTQSVVAACVLAAVLCSLRRCHRAFSKILTVRTRGIILLVHLPACIFLYFAAGRLTVAPLRNGLHSMDHFGCCSQALVFPRERIADLNSLFSGRTHWLRRRSHGALRQETQSPQMGSCSECVSAHWCEKFERSRLSWLQMESDYRGEHLELRLRDVRQREVMTRSRDLMLAGYLQNLPVMSVADKGSDRAYTAAVIPPHIPRETVVHIAQSIVGYRKRKIDGMIGNGNRAYSQCTLHT